MHQVTNWLSAVPALIGFGLALGLNPALYGATADTLARGGNVRSRVGWMLAGLVVGATILIVVLHSFNPDGLVSAAKGWMDAAIFNKIADIVAGIVSLVMAVVVVLWKVRTPQREQRAPRTPKDNAQSISFFALGLSCSVIGFTTLPIMYLTGRVVNGVSHNPVPRILAYGVFLVALIAPFLLLAWLWSKFPKAGMKVTAGYQKALSWDYRWLTAASLVIIGLICFALAFFWHP